MSFNRENVAWQKDDGTWSIGFWPVTVIGPDDEWDVEYDYDSFRWVSTGHPDPDTAFNAYTREHANPGVQTICTPGDTSAEEIASFDAFAADCLARQERAEQALRTSFLRY
jgi:hypothetical protein